jgi:glycosyltransferase involved in cell wall biosynthesis
MSVKRDRTVSLCMIVRDEAETLQRAIESVCPVVDEIVIGIDDRTTDSSEEIARRFSDKVYRFKWRDSFAAARNEMLARCTGEWVLSLDGHEVLRESCVALFREMLEHLPEGIEAVGFRVQMQAEDSSVSGIQIRLFRHNGRLRYTGDVHNVIACDEEKTIGFADIVIDHLRTARNRERREKQRNEMVPRKMREALRKNPRDTKALYYLGMHAHERKDYREAIKHYRRYLKCSKHPEERYKVIWQLGRALYQSGDKQAARETFVGGIQERWDLPECYVALGDIALQEKKWDEAEHYFKLAVDRRLPLSGVFFSQDFYTWLPYHKLCEVYDRSGRYYDAIVTAEKLLAIASLPEEHRRDVKRCLPAWAEKVIDSQSVQSGERSKRNFLIVDKVGSFSRELADHFRGKFNVEVIRTFLPQYMKWADVAWFDWCDENVALASQVRWGCPVICTFRSYEYFTEHPRKVNWANVDHVVFVAQHVRHLSLNKFREIRYARTSVIPDGVELDRFTYREGQPGRNIAWVGYLNHKKNVPLLLEIASQMRDCEFHVAGIFQDERLRVYWEHYVKENELSNVRLYGWVEDINAFLEDKNYILSTSLWEGTQVAVLEAMAKGVKPLVHAWIGARELYGDVGIYRNTSELREILTEGEYRSGTYREWIEEHYSLSKRLARIEEIVERAKEKPTRIEGEVTVGGPIREPVAASTAASNPI